MTEHHEDPDVLAGIDGPRPLPAGLRQRLEDRLLVDASRPLDPELAGRLSDTLIGSPSGPARPAGRRLRPPLRPRLVAAVAAGLLIAGGVGAAVEAARHSAPALHSASSAAGSTSGSSSSSGATRTAGPADFGASRQGPGRSQGLLAPAPAVPTGNSSAVAGPTGAAEAPLSRVGAPAVTSLTPGRGPTAGGTWVTITGRDLAGVVAVRFGTVPAARYVVVSATEVRALTPVGTPGTVRVTVAGRYGTATGSFTYT